MILRATISAIILAACLLGMARPCDAQIDSNATRNDSALFRYVFDIPGRYINDHCLIRSGNLWHLYFIEGVTSILYWDREGNEVLIGHATSPDLTTWTLLDPALRTGTGGALDNGHVTAPYVIEREGTFYMFYGGTQKLYEGFTGPPFVNGSEHFLLATSRDLYNWTRYPVSPIMSPDTSWACYTTKIIRGDSGGPISGRDAHLIYDARYGYIFYYVARLRGDSARHSHDQEYSCVAAATSPDLVNWTDRGPLVVRKTIGTEEYSWNHPESPCVIKHGEFYYLFWKGGDGTRYVIGDDPLHFVDSTETFLATSHASEVFDWNGTWYITSCSRQINDIAHKYSDRTRGLYMARIVWNGTRPEVAPLVDPSSSVPTEPDIATTLHPNPARAGETVLLEFDGETVEGFQAHLFDAIGNRLREPRIEIGPHGRIQVALATAGLSAGTYLVKVEVGGRVVTKMFVVW